MLQSINHSHRKDQISSVEQQCVAESLISLTFTLLHLKYFVSIDHDCIREITVQNRYCKDFFFSYSSDLCFGLGQCDTLAFVREFFEQAQDQRPTDALLIKQIRRCLADLKAFSRLCQPLQDRFLQKALFRWFDRSVSLSLSSMLVFMSLVSSYPENEVILQQHDLPTNFHLILTGKALVTYQRLIDGHLETLSILSRGGTFGVSDSLFE